jgi:hypothetical protein
MAADRKTYHLMSGPVNRDVENSLTIRLATLVAGTLAGFCLFACDVDSDAQDNAKRRTRSKMEILDSALQSYKDDRGIYPTTSESLKSLLGAGIQKAYLRESGSILMDEWGNPFVYISPDPRKGQTTFRLYSVGPNGIDEGGAGDDLMCCREKSTR